MTLSLDDLKNAFAKPQQSTQNSNYDKFYPFWKMEVGETAKVRFLPDADKNNPMGFLLENTFHRLEINGKKRIVPCLSMYGESCPCCELAQKYYSQDDEVNGQKFYKKREYFANMVIIDSPFDVEDPQDVKIVSMGPKIFKLIQNAFTSDDLENPPYFIKGGHNFRFKKSENGNWASYDLSSFEPRSSDLDDDAIANVELLNLSDFRTKKMDRTTMEAMLISAQTGENYEQSSSNTSESVNTSPGNTVVENATPAKSESSSQASDLLARIRERAQAQA